MSIKHLFRNYLPPVKSAKQFLRLKMLTFFLTVTFFLIFKFFHPIFPGYNFFLNLQRVRSTAYLGNDSFTEFRDYIEGIEVSGLPFDIQETASEVIQKRIC